MSMALDARFAIDYSSYDPVVEHLREQLPYAWLQAYKAMCAGPTNVLVVAASGFEYLFDYSSELDGDIQEDRVVAAHGCSRAPSRERDASRLRGFPSDAERGDRGHFLAHSAGGGLEINIFHQAAALNRGWSQSGKTYRAMERYCARHPGTYFFSRPIYQDATARPTLVEFGVLKADPMMWVELFENS